MRALIAAGFSRVRTVMLLLALIFLAGAYSYIVIPKEASPEIDIPIFIVNITYPGISAEDSARLLAEPMERQLQSLNGLNQMTSQAGEGFATITLEFDPGFNHQIALQSVRDEAENATPDLPAGADQPIVREVDMSRFPILTVALSGPVPERDLIRMARELQEALDTIPGVLESGLTGDREDLLEIIINPLAQQSYGISTEEISRAIQSNNQLIAAGAFDTGAGRIGVSIPGTIQSLADVLAIPVQVTDHAVVRVQDVGEVRRTYHDATSFARIDGQPTVAIDVRKAAGANIIDTVARVQAMTAEISAGWTDMVQVDYLQNQAEDIEQLLGDLENNVIAAVLLVMLTTILALGLRASLLVAIAIPGSFLGGILIIYVIGFTLNIVVLFGLILVIGMLVDGAIVVVELAERYRSEGMARREAFRNAAQRMAWPITASTATTLAVFLPLLFWPGTAGQFMRFLPATVIVTLLASLIMALFFVPVIGALVKGSAPAVIEREGGQRPQAYDRVLDYMIARPGFALGLSLLVLVASFMAYGTYGRGTDFFPAVEPERAQVQVRAGGNLSVLEADRLVRMVENRLMGIEGIDRVYSRTIGAVEERLRSDLNPDVIGTIQIDFTEWRHRPPASEIIETMRSATAKLPGLGVQIAEQQMGPGAARPVQIEVSSDSRENLAPAAEKLRTLMREQGTFVDISSDVPRADAEIRLVVDREQAARYGVDIDALGSAVQLLTDGVVMGTYLPEFATDEVEIRLRYPAEDRNFTQLADLRISTRNGMVPMANFVMLDVAPAPSVINRVNARNVQTVSAALVEGATVAQALEDLQERLAAVNFGDDVQITFAGEVEEQEEAMIFLITAFIIAILLMFLILLTQLDSFFQSVLVLSAIVFSFAGVFLGLVIRQEPFSVVMSGIGIVALAGIVVNNNIVLIDSYNEHRGNGLDPIQAAHRAGTERFRPVLLTAITTIIGLMPMVLGMTVDFFGRDIYLGAPSGQFWIQLSTSIVGGLAFSTSITVLLTPALLAWDGKRRQRRQKGQAKRANPDRRQIPT